CVNIFPYCKGKYKYFCLDNQHISLFSAKKNIWHRLGFDALFTLLYNTATRIDELLSLKLDDLHIGEHDGKNYITVWGKGTKLRNIYLLPEVVKIIRQYVHMFHGDTPNKDEYLFIQIIMAIGIN
ncbi:tyrosine-type recombinase/integrase, partial [Alistipes onderdonkii]|uniref:tyrosine-type recombinase/integrase n=1 Tax=Alistipes onderdonkii TaxID=328813 RepID=UPI00210976A9